jgi:hypothetical protein
MIEIVFKLCRHAKAFNTVIFPTDYGRQTSCKGQNPLVPVELLILGQ